MYYIIEWRDVGDTTTIYDALKKSSSRHSAYVSIT